MANKAKSEQAKIEESYEIIYETKENVSFKIPENYKTGTDKWTTISSVFFGGILKTTSVCNIPTGCVISVDISKNDSVSTDTVYIPNIKYNKDTCEFVMNV